jgi:hypothetical protein
MVTPHLTESKQYGKRNGGPILSQYSRHVLGKKPDTFVPGSRRNNQRMYGARLL